MPAATPARARFLPRFYRVAYRLLRLYQLLARPDQFGVKCIITRGELVLLVRHTYGRRNEWDLPGGTLKRREDPLAAARREAKEEVGLTIPTWRALGALRGRSERRQHTLYFCTAEAPDADPVADRVEIAEARWFPLGGLPEKTGRYARRMLRLAAEKREQREQ